MMKLSQPTLKSGLYNRSSPCLTATNKLRTNFHLLVMQLIKIRSNFIGRRKHPFKKLTFKKRPPSQQIIVQMRINQVPLYLALFVK